VTQFYQGLCQFARASGFFLSPSLRLPSPVSVQRLLAPASYTEQEPNLADRELGSPDAAGKPASIDNDDVSISSNNASTETDDDTAADDRSLSGVSRTSRLSQMSIAKSYTLITWGTLTSAQLGAQLDIPIRT
jgi:hypothetical protein